MKSKLVASVLGAAILLGLVWTTGSPWAQEKKADGEKPAAQKRERARPRGRLPNYYRTVVSPEQREKIYGIQKTYQAKIDDIEKQLADLIAKRDAEIEGVLTPEQLAKVKKLQDEAAAKREAARKRREAAAAKAEATTSETESK